MDILTGRSRVFRKILGQPFIARKDCKQTLTPGLDARGGCQLSDPLMRHTDPNQVEDGGFAQDSHPPCQPFLINSVPKAGTHLLHKLVTLLPGVQHPGVTVCLVAKELREQLTGEKDKLFPYGFNWTEGTPPEALEEAFSRVCPGDFGYGHLPYAGHAEALLQRINMKMLLILRDPRDVVVSLAYYLPTRPMHRAYQYYASASMEERLMLSIEGNLEKTQGAGVYDIKARFAGYTPWIDRPGVLFTRFESLIGPPGGVSNRQTQFDEIKRIADHIGVTLGSVTAEQVANRLFGGTATFRTGTIGSWKTHFSADHRRRFKEVAGDLLIELGYERDHDW